MGEHLGDGVDVGSSGYEQGGVGVAEAVEGDVFVDSGGFHPVFEPSVHKLTGESFEDFAFGRTAAEFESLGADGDGGFGVGLFGFDADAFASRRVVLDVAPFELEYVAEAKAGEAGEESCGFKDGIVASGVRKSLEFFLCEIFALGFLGLYLV